MNLISKSIRLILILSVFFAVPLQAILNASEIKHAPHMVMGTIEEVTYSSLRIDGKYYDISHAVILSVRGIQLTKDQLRAGGEVEIWFDGNEATSVIVKNKHHNIKE
ncbi:MAG: hypothetical protein FJ240_01910 [Nitrospira sp.]|nr:hypothetical protein [Nitrospira sp.]